MSEVLTGHSRFFPSIKTGTHEKVKGDESGIKTLKIYQSIIIKASNYDIFWGVIYVQIK